MTTFEFSLEKVLAYQITKKINIEKELKDIQVKISEINEEINKFVSLLKKTNEGFKITCKNGIDRKTIIMYKAYSNLLSGNIANCKRELEKQEYFKKELLIKLKNQNIEVKKIERFKENKLREFNKDEEKKQEKSIEEFISSLRNY